MSTRAFTQKHKQKWFNELAAPPVLQPKPAHVDTELPEMLPRKNNLKAPLCLCAKLIPAAVCTELSDFSSASANFTND